MKTKTTTTDAVSGEPTRLIEGAWYVDRSLTHEGLEVGTRLRVVKLGALTVRIVDEHGETREVNRLMFEAQMREESETTKRPKRPAVT